MALDVMISSKLVETAKLKLRGTVTNRAYYRNRRQWTTETLDVMQTVWHLYIALSHSKSACLLRRRNGRGKGRWVPRVREKYTCQCRKGTAGFPYQSEPVPPC